MNIKNIFSMGLLAFALNANAQTNTLFGSYWTGSEEIFTSLDISTKTFIDIDTLGGVNFLTQGESTFDPNNGRYFNNTDLGITIIDIQNGAIIDTIANTIGMKGIEYDIMSNRLFGSYWTGSEEIFTSLDISTKTFMDVDTLGGVNFLTQGESTFDPNNGIYFNNTDLGITIIDIQNGAIIDTIANTIGMKGIEFPFSHTVTSTDNGINSFGNNLFFYPNPTSGNFSIDLGSTYENSKILITDISGKLIDSKIFTHSQILDLSIKQPNGIYIVSVQAGDKKAVIRLIKQ